MSPIVRDVRRHIFADRAVTARQRLHQPPVFVAQRAGQAVDLGLGGQRDRRIVRQIEEPPHARDEFAASSAEKAFSRLIIARACATLARCAAGAAPTANDGESDAHQMRKRRLDRGIAPGQRIVIGVGNLRRVVGVVQPIMVRDLRRQPRQFDGGFVVGRGEGGGHTAGLAEGGVGDQARFIGRLFSCESRSPEQQAPRPHPWAPACAGAQASQSSLSSISARCLASSFTERRSAVFSARVAISSHDFAARSHRSRTLASVAVEASDSAWRARSR